MQRFMRRVAVIGGARIPFCRSNTFYADLTNLDLMTGALNALIDRYGLKGQHIDEVVGGAVITHSKDFNLTREAVLGTALAPSTPGITMMQACGTSLQAALGSAAKIATGDIDCAIAVGSDTTSDAPIVVSKKLAKRLTQAAQRKTFMDKLKTFKGFAPGELVPQAPANAEPRTGLSMGEHAEMMAREWDITRDAQDRFALESHLKAAEAYRSGYMDDIVTPFAGVFRDNNIRADASIDKLSSLKASFDKSGKGTLTAGNSTPLTDGAAAVLLASEEWAEKHALPVAVYLTYSQSAANDFVAGDGLLMAPTIAVSRMLDRAGLKLQDFDFYEIHEAFAAQVLATLKAWEDPTYCKEVLGRPEAMGAIDPAKINVHGSSIALGHPFAATGARIVGNMAKLLAGHHGRGLISICTAGGMGVAAILESKDAAEIHQAA
ncbi:acetyl-CoA C-acetyltransferase [Hyphomicrobium sp. D-2]|uniref:acetyl-CoA C-acetyltransferase n=1 Tax=Hyphomicrobium sp. D-2 TaxID=3041621 RepID=UPI002456B7D7|nr:acetyl-CoA C-acetyltransferase [Hyphomicrobium sp. D-2]MDH4981806.1 acetyl-CoA C-acetyltransferase [Hyphomicrobium sp. D-2]